MDIYGNRDESDFETDFTPLGILLLEDDKGEKMDNPYISDIREILVDTRANLAKLQRNWAYSATATHQLIDLIETLEAIVRENDIREEALEK
jgi:hypothetical protein